MGGSYQQQKKKKVLDKEFEELEVLGQEDEKRAVKEGKPILEEQEKKKKENKDKLLDLMMGASSGNKQSYIFFMAELLDRRMKTVEFPTGWTYEISPTDVGIILELFFWDRIFRSAFTPCGEAVYDLNAVETFGVRAENTIDKYGTVNQGTVNPKDN